jgi:beta-phosphoglucomutase-like phosphatase (HAD superfamily)
VITGCPVDVVPELHHQWPVEAERHADLLDRGLVRGRPREERRRIAGKRAREQERHDHDADEVRDGARETLEDELQHFGRAFTTETQRHREKALKAR